MKKTSIWSNKKNPKQYHTKLDTQALWLKKLSNNIHELTHLDFNTNTSRRNTSYNKKKIEEIRGRKTSYNEKKEKRQKL